mmetsp:Transcript_18002/g.27503  ORF Transcript_18002/g.27503 Transcript_18002/m.27503 type:complete len:104 (-) Transcript_18002:36-347(-)
MSMFLPPTSSVYSMVTFAGPQLLKDRTNDEKFLHLIFASGARNSTSSHRSGETATTAVLQYRGGDRRYQRRLQRAERCGPDRIRTERTEEGEYLFLDILVNDK